MIKEIYNSSNFNYKHFIEQKFMIKNKDEQSDFQDVVNKKFRSHEVSVFIKENFVDIYLLYNVKNAQLKEKVQKVALSIQAKSYFDKYKAFDCKNSYRIFPNEVDKDFYIEFYNIIDVKFIDNTDRCIINIICPVENVNYFVKGNRANNNLDISLFLDRINLTDLEKKFVVQNFKNEQKGIVLDKKKEKSSDLFTDFMNKDDFDNNSFVITENEKNVFNPKSLKIVDGFDDPSCEMNRLVGLLKVKKEILKLNAKVNYQYDRISRNIYDENTTNLHMCFFGNPGTGKTTVARIITSILYNMGYIKRNKCIEINANEFKGAAIGETAIKTKIILRNSVNKVLFIDEAYSLYDRRDGFGQEAVDTIIKEMEDNRKNMVIIFAGYKGPMQDFINMNEGLRSRISRYIEFENYNIVELCKIFVNMLHENNLKIETDAFIKIIKIFKEMSLQNNFSNGRFVRNIFEELMEEHAFKVQEGVSKNNYICACDITDELIKQLYIQNKNIY